MRLEQLFTQEELSLIDSGEYRPGRAVLDAKLDLWAAAEREACAKVCEDMGRGHGSAFAEFDCVAAIRARGEK